jgi:acyl-CoA synthetase (AMP-forming)/AMP-acid ligase II
VADLIQDAATLWQLLDRRVAASPDRLMLIDDGGRSLTFAEFRDRAERVAAGFLALGVVEGTPVTWILPTRIETILVSSALSRLGAVQNPIIHIYRHREVGFCIRQTGAEMVVVPGIWNGFDFSGMVADVAADLDSPPRVVVGYDRLPDGDPATLPPAPTPPDRDEDAPVRWLYFTSGTTSDPKGVKHTDATLIAGGLGLARALQMTGDDVGTLAFPYAHIAGPDYLVTVLASGFPVVVIEQFTPAGAVAAFAEHGVTMAGGSTAFYQMYLTEDQKVEGPSMPALRMMSGGGAPKPPEVFHEIKEKMGIPVVHGYGMTECPIISHGSIGDTDEQLANTDGRPIEGCEVAIVRPDGRTAAVGEEGEVRVTGSMLFKGYLDPSLDVAAFDEAGRFRTGDLGVMRADGHLMVSGRLKDIIIRKGENISARELEDVLYSHPKVEAAVVIGLPDAQRGERVCAVVEQRPGSEPLTFEEMTEAFAAAGLMRQKTPEQLEVYPGPLPRNPTLKILKHQLREEYSHRPWP